MRSELINSNDKEGIRSATQNDLSCAYLPVKHTLGGPHRGIPYTLLLHEAAVPHALLGKSIFLRLLRKRRQTKGHLIPFP